MDATKIQSTIDAIKDDLARAIESGDRGQAAACRTNLAAFSAMKKKALQSTCYDCKTKKHRAHTKWAFRTNTQGKGCRVRVCEPPCRRAP